MQIVVTATKPVRTVEGGTLPRDVKIEVSDALGRFLVERGEAVLYETKVAQENPSVAAGQAKPSASSPAAQASAPKTLQVSKAGAKAAKRGK